MASEEEAVGLSPALAQIPTHILELYRKRFNAMDLDKDGVVSLREMAAVGKVFGYRLSFEELKDIFNKRDLDDSGTITFDEFVTAMIERAKRNKALEPMRAKFWKYDKRRRGYITSDEAYPILEELLGFDMNKTETLIDMFDKNKDYRISIHEFVRFNQKVEELKAIVEKAFQQFDRNGDGYVDFEEAKAMMASKGYSDSEVYQFFQKYDLDGDGKLNYQEFARFWDVPIF